MQGAHQTLQRRGAREDCAVGMVLLACHCYSREGGVLGQLKVEATGPEAGGSRWAVPGDMSMSHISLRPLKG